MRRSLVLVAIAAAAILATLGVTYYFTVEPAPTLKIRWRADISPAGRADVERRYRLVRPTLDGGRTYRYDLLDTGPGNIEALVADPAVEDTSDVDRVHYQIGPDYPYGKGWTWAAYRVPILRAPGVIEAVVGVSAAALILAVAGLVRDGRRRDQRSARTTSSSPRSPGGA